MMDIPPRVSVRRQPIDLAALSFICAANDNVSRVASDFKLFVNNSLQEAFQTQIIKGFCDLWSIEDVPQALSAVRQISYIVSPWMSCQRRGKTRVSSVVPVFSDWDLITAVHVRIYVADMIRGAQPYAIQYTRGGEQVEKELMTR